MSKIVTFRLTDEELEYFQKYLDIVHNDMVPDQFKMKVSGTLIKKLALKSVNYFLKNVQRKW